MGNASEVVIHNPRGQLGRGGGGISQMTILLRKPYLVKATTRGRGSKIPQKFDHVVYGWPLMQTSSKEEIFLINSGFWRGQEKFLPSREPKGRKAKGNLKINGELLRTSNKNQIFWRENRWPGLLLFKVTFQSVISLLKWTLSCQNPKSKFWTGQRPNSNSHSKKRGALIIIVLPETILISFWVGQSRNDPMTRFIKVSFFRNSLL